MRAISKLSSPVGRATLYFPEIRLLTCRLSSCGTVAKSGVGFVHWVQDMYSLAIEFFLRRRWSDLAAPLSIPFRMLEKKVCSTSNAVIVIAPAFRDRLLRWGVAPSKVTVLDNWAPLEEMDCLPRANPLA